MIKIIKIQKTGTDAVIVSQANKRPNIYEGLTQAILNEFFFDAISKEFQKVESLSMLISIEFNPPTTKSE